MARIVTQSYPDFVRMSFSSQQQSCWVFQDAFIKIPSNMKENKWVMVIYPAKNVTLEGLFLVI